MLKTNLPNQIRQMPLPVWRPMLPIFEATMNSFQAIREAKNKAGVIHIEIQRQPSLLDEENAPISNFVIRDNGVGFNDRNFDSFNTLYSDHKMKEGGKGLGRFTWLKAFDHVEIETTFKENEGHFSRKFIFDEGYDIARGDATPTDNTTTGTLVRLVGFKEPYRSQFPRTSDQFIQRLVEHFLLVFIESDCPVVTLQDGLQCSANEVFEKDFKASARKKTFKVKNKSFTLFGFQLATPRLSNHKLVYAANQRGVLSETLDKFVPNLSSRLPNPNGSTFVYLAIVQGNFLNAHVNSGRTDFDIGLTSDDDILANEVTSSLLTDEIARADIRAECINHIQADLAGSIQSINDAKSDKVRGYIDQDAPQYKILMKHMGEFIDRLSANPGRTEIETVLHQEIHNREVKLKQESTRILREADKTGADFAEIDQHLDDFIENYNELGVAALARYVGQRRLLLDHLERAINKREDTGRYPLERVVHQLIFPRHKTSDDVAQSEQNLWMIDERLTYQTFISSDKPIASLRKQISSGSRREPDLLMFDRKIVFSEDDQPVKSIIMVEFKKPMLNNYTMEKNPLLQCFEMVEDIRSSKFLDPTTGRPISVSNSHIPAYCYIICDITESLKRVLKTFQALITPDEQGYYGFHPQYATYFEVTDYNKLLRDAKQRNRTFFDKLNVLGSR